MSENVEWVTVDASNLDEQGFFCYKSKKKSEGYRNKLAWMRDRIAEGLVIHMAVENGRSVGYVEYAPGEHAWRAVEAPGWLVVHCLWVVGRGKKKGYGSRLIDLCVEDAQQKDKRGVAMVSSRGNWLAHEKVFLKNAFQEIAQAPPSFKLLVKPLRDGPLPAFPTDWDQRAARYGEGMTVVYADQCPYTPDAVDHARETFEQRGVPTRAVKLESSAEARTRSPSAYGVFGIVYNGKLFCYHYLGKKETKQLDQMLKG